MKRLAIPAVLACLWLLSTGAAARQLPQLTVFAASDLGPALQKIVPLFEGAAGAKVTVVLGSSGTMAQQIRNGAPADVFFSASDAFIDGLAPDGLVLANTRVRYARGRIVVAALKTSPLRIASLPDLADPRVRRVAIANPAHAPYGVAAREALEAMELWSVVQPKLVFGENVQQAVQFVRSGAADAGIVARSIVDTPDLSWTFLDASLHAPINQAACVVTRTKQPGLARSFLEFVNGVEGRPVMRQLGFLLPGEDF
ncbi:MAG: molybdate ABC transporter substrate-binding protein [Vicinamibacterales bacterium]|nr:molybdate ABC transporter substrate-binding protein [Vicinamibacterales bacterium]